MASEKPYRIRVKVVDGKPREHNKLKGQLVPHVDVINAKNGVEFLICAVKESHLDQVRARFAAAGLEEVTGGDTDVSAIGQPISIQPKQDSEPSQQAEASRTILRPDTPTLQPKPYAFVPLPEELTTAPPVWHDGTTAAERLSGEIRCEIETLTPLLVGWERRQIGDADEAWGVPFAPASGADLDGFLQEAARQEYPNAERREQQHNVERARRQYIDGMRGEVVELSSIQSGRTVKSKSLLCPLRAPWGDRPVLLPGDSIKGLLRHELGALLGAPMERVAERSYSYRPNSLYPRDPNPRLVPRLARIADDAIETRPLEPDESVCVRVPVRLDLLPENLKYDRQQNSPPPRYRFDVHGGAAYRGGQGAGEMLNSKRRLHQTLEANPDSPTTSVPVPDSVQSGYIHTLRHLVDVKHGHFSERHPDVPNTVTCEDARRRILNAASNVVFQAGDLIWVEWDTHNKCVASLGWHYYYRWAYNDTVRWQGWAHERRGLFPLDEERATDDADAPRGLSAVRRLFGYTGDNEGSSKIGKRDHAQLMGRISVNAAIEVIGPGDTDETRFLPPTFLKELGMPRPSAVEHYLQQPHYPNPRPSDRAALVTYGDAAGYDKPGKLAGRKFYLDRSDAYSSEPWKKESESNRLNKRSTLAFEASRPGRRFRFTVRFRDLDSAELASVLIALGPHQFRTILGGNHLDGYCSKLGHARPLGWGGVRIEAKELYLLDTSGDKPALNPVTDLSDWLREYYKAPSMLKEWLAIYRRNNPDAADYPRQGGEIYTYHSGLRAEHSRARRYDRGGSR
jgi:CRISPR-associated protein (TIGR03986 family)